MRAPVLDLSECTDCEGCLAVAPRVFQRDPTGRISVAELPGYPAEEVDEAIMNCPRGCIRWEENE